MAKTESGEAGRIVGGAADVLCDITLTLSEPIREVPSGQMVVEVATFRSALAQLRSIMADKDVQMLGSSSKQRTDGTWLGGFRLGVRAGDMEGVVTRLEALGRVESRQIIGLGLGDLSQADPNAVGVIALTLAEKSTIAPSPDRASDSIRAKLREGLAGLYSSIGLIAYGLIVLAPWLVIVGLAVWLVARRLRKRRAS